MRQELAFVPGDVPTETSGSNPPGSGTTSLPRHILSRRPDDRIVDSGGLVDVEIGR
jgi:hypothetical protein